MVEKRNSAGGLETSKVLEVKNLVKTFPGVTALDRVCFELRRGEVHALVGENGAGKSTLIQTLGGVYRPEEGEIFLNGEKVVFRSPYAAVLHGIGVVFQENSLCPNLSVAENIFAHRQPVKSKFLNLIDWSRLYCDTEELLRLFDLDVSPHAKVKDLPGAFQQLVEILKAISVSPFILILDEPTSSLTAKEKELLFNNMRRLKEEGLSIIYISHHLPEVFEIADRVTVLRDGKHVHTCRVKDINEVELANRMVGRELKDMYPMSRSEPGGECFRMEDGAMEGFFSGINFSVRHGEIVGMAGLAGSGRTEIARAIFGAELLTGGTLYLEGKRVAIKSPAQAISRKIGYLTEDRKEQGLFLDMDIRTNCAAPSLISFERSGGIIDEKALLQFAKNCVKNFNITATGVNQKVLNLSGGNQQKVLLSMWMGVNPKFLIVDEPTRGVDVGAKAEIYKRIRELAENGIGILMISSDLPEILGMSDRILVVRNGRLVKELSSDEATEENIIAYATSLGVERE